jgi:uncharacterized Zn finger protein
MNASKLNVSLNKTTPIVCEKCGNQTFTEAVILREVSKFLTGQPQDGIIPIPVFACNSCGHINEKFMPPELKQDDK